MTDQDSIVWRDPEAADRDAFDALSRACREADGPPAVPPPSFEALLSGLPFVTCSAWSGTDLLAMGWVKFTGESVIRVAIHPAQRASDIGASLIGRLQGHAHVMVKALVTYVRDEALTPDAEALYARCGYTCNFIEYWLRRDLRTPLPDVPSLESYETWTDDSIPRFVETYVEGFRDRWAGRAFDVSGWAEENAEDEEFRPDMTLLALADGKPAGFVTTFIEAGSGEGFVSQIAVRPEYRRRGIAAGLLVTVMGMLREAGASRVDLHVNEDNIPARALYEKLGFVRVGRRGKYSRTFDPWGITDNPAESGIIGTPSNQVSQAAHGRKHVTTTSTLTVRKVESSRDFKAFFEFPWTVYKDDPNWVPPLLSMRRHLLDKAKNPSFEYLDADYYVAWRGDQPVGTIAAFINHRHDEYHPEDNGLGWFGFFECLDDAEAARALLGTALDYARAKGNCSAVRGPASFTLNDECALLIENFDQPVILMPYNPPYYQRLIEDSGLGYDKIMDTVSVLAEPDKYLDANGNLTPKLIRMMELLKTKGGISSRLADTGRLTEEIALLRKLYSSAWEKNWGFVPPTEREMDDLFKTLKQYFYPGLGVFGVVADKEVGFILGLPDMNQVLRRAYARPGTPEVWTLLKALWHWKIRPKITRQRLLLFGILEAYRGKGVDGAILAEYLKQSITSYPVCDAGWILETNTRTINEMNRFDARIYKRFRFYQAPLG